MKLTVRRMNPKDDMRKKAQETASAQAVTVQRVVMRPADATQDALRGCLKWLDACRELGWSEELMPELEELWWKYKDSFGNPKPPNESSSPTAADGAGGAERKDGN